MSHEIRTPLNGVVGMIDLIEQTDLRPLQKEYFQTVKESSENLIYVVNQIMDISKLDSGKMSLETSNFSVYDLFNECVKVFSDIANEKGLKLSFIPCANRDFWVNADKYRLKQIVVNLLSNAIKYSDKGTIVLHYVCASTSENGIKLRFCISD